MALSPLRKCTYAGCNSLVRATRCDKHAKEKRQPDTNRPNSHRRGYDKRWSNENLTGVRDVFIATYPLCHDCEANGITRAAEQVHHKLKVKDHPELRLEWSNLMSLCESCHSRRTARGE